MKTFFFIMIASLMISCHSGIGDDLQPVPVSDVKLRGEIGRRLDMTIDNNLMAIDVFEQLSHFRNQREDPVFRDDFCGIGMFIDGLVGFAFYRDDEELTRYKDEIISELIDTQDESGYIGLYPNGFRKQQWDTHESSYIIISLVSDYKYFGNTRSLEAAIRLADNMIISGDGYTCGFEPALIALYKATSNRKYLDYCIDDLGLPAFKGGSEHNSTHVYGYLARAYSQLLLDDIKPDPQLIYRSKAAFENMITFHAMDITGTIGSWEHWYNVQSGVDACGETCASAYALKMLDKLVQKERNSVYGDVMERIIYNALFAAQSPDGRHLRYFTPFEDERKYYADDYFCCPNNFRRIMSQLPALIYYSDGDGIYVNLYESSDATILIGNTPVSVSQDTGYPTSGNININLSLPGSESFSLYLRIPGWCERPGLSINGEPYSGEIMRGHYLKVERDWNDGDLVELDLPMDWRFVRGKMEQYGRAALLRGPVVYCLGNEDNDNLLDASHRRQRIVVDPNSISGPVTDDSFRPGGLRCSVDLVSVDGKEYPGRQLIFTEFINPDGIKTFIDMPDRIFSRATVEDEFMLKDAW